MTMDALKTHLQRLAKVLEDLEVYDLDPLSICAELDGLEEEYKELQSRAKAGIPTEKVSPQGVETVIEARPEIELACIKDRTSINKLRYELVKDIVKTSQLQEPPDSTIVINMVRREAKP